GQVELALRAQDGRQRIVRLPAASLLAADGGDPAAALGLKVWNPPIPPRLGTLIAGGAGERQGLRSGDTVLAVDGAPVADWVAFVEQVRAAPGRTLQLSILRAGARLDLAITPDAERRDGHSIGRIGAGVDVALTDPFVVRIQRGPVDALREGVRRTWDLGGMMLSTLGRMLVGGVSTRAIGGPLQIAAAAGDSAQLGLVPFLGFLAVISVSLGVLNLLPIPVLDGGHLLYYSFELISGRPLPDRIIAAGTRAGIVLLFGLMALAFYNDINRFFSG
ncbi:MAG: RIP metalloprotease RseP, partial [Pseudomonadota bacterium]|nr:RIP metalloprotease RseP [Pseudomonadota bacterium]